jgi:NADPH:quinone reductase-like Zn-dependent oxidoreductase
VALDLAGGEALEATPSLLTPTGRWASIVDPSVTERGGRYVFVRPDATDLSALASLVDDGRLTVPVAKTFPLAEAGEAQQLSASGHTRGKIVLEMI